MASAKKEAENLLGSINDYINIKGLNKERKIAKNVYNTNKASYENAYNDLLNTLSSNRNDARLSFNKGRSEVGENAYMKNREASSDLASRGLSGGISQLNKLGTRMETGRQYSDLANTFYRTMDDINTRQTAGERDYNLGLETAKNTLSAALADIGAREAAGRNAYKAQVAQLAEQIQARRAAAAAAAAQNRLLAQQYAQAKKDKNSAFNAKLFELYGENPNQQSYENAIKYYRQVKGGNTADAVKYLTKIGVGNGVGQQGIIGPTQPWVDYSNRTNTNTTNNGFKWTNLLNILGPSTLYRR